MWNKETLNDIKSNKKGSVRERGTVITLNNAAHVHRPSRCPYKFVCVLRPATAARIFKH